MNYFKSFSYNQIKNQQKTVKLKVTVFVITLCFNLLLILFSSFIYTLKQQSYDIYGEWKGVLPVIGKTEEQYIQKHNDIQGFSYRVASIRILDRDENEVDMGTISGLDEQAQKLFHLHLLQGRLPENEDEIAVDANVLSTLGIDYTLGKEITLPIEQGNTMEFTLCGIIKPFRYRWSLKDQTIIPTAIVKRTSQEKTLWLSDELAQKHHSNLHSTYQNTFAFQKGINRYLSDWKFIVGSISLLIVFLIFGYGMIHMLFHHMGEDFSILQRIGIAPMDLRKIRFWIFYYTVRFSVPLGFVSAGILSCLLSWLFPTSFYLHISIFGCMMMTLLLTFIMMVSIPRYRKETRIFKPIITKHPRVLNSYHRFHAFSYTLRNLQVCKISSILIVLLTSIMVVGQTYCFLQQVALNEKMQIELKQETDFDYIISFQQQYAEDEIIKGISTFDLQQLYMMGECNDIFTLKINFANYTFPNQNQSEEWMSYRNFLEYSNFNEMKYPTVIGISDSPKSRALIASLGVQKVFWKSNGAIFNTMYFLPALDIDGADSIIYAGHEYVSTGEKKERLLKEKLVKQGTTLTFAPDITLKTLGFIQSYQDMENLAELYEMRSYAVITDDQVFHTIFPQHDTVQYVYMKVSERADFTTDAQIMNVLSKYKDIQILNQRLPKDAIKQSFYEGMSLYCLMEFMILLVWILMMLRLHNIKYSLTIKTRNILSYVGIHKGFFVKASLIETTCLCMGTVLISWLPIQFLLQNISFEINQRDMFEQTLMASEFIGRYDGVMIMAIGVIVTIMYSVGLLWVKERRH